MVQTTGKTKVKGFDPAVRARYEEAVKEYRRTVELLDELRRVGVGRPGYRLALPHHHGPSGSGGRLAASGVDPHSRR